MKIIRCYPDYQKTPPDYVVNLMEVLNLYPDSVVALLVDLRTGIPGKCQFLPAIADVVKLADELLEKQRERERQEDLASRRDTYRPMSMDAYRISMRGGHARFEPFPRLWGAFVAERDLLKGKSFECLYDASKALATRGKEAAKRVLTRDSAPMQKRDLRPLGPFPEYLLKTDFMRDREE